MTSYDVIVVGAGAAGAPLAARLSEDPGRRVLLVEAGPDAATTADFPSELLDAGSLASSMPGHPNNWSFDTHLTPDSAFNVARGKAMGGSTALNGTYYIRARRADFDRWAAAGNTEWAYDKVLRYFQRQESDQTYHHTAVHGDSGPVPVYREIDHPHELTHAFYAACRELGFPEEADKNDQGEPGYGPLPVNALDGVRVNTALAYLTPNLDRANLSVRGGVLARQVRFDGRRAIGLEVQTAGGQIETYDLTDAGEVVLCAGAIKSAHLLALSGIGPRAELEAAGIAVVCQRPAVGKNFADHPEYPLVWRPLRRMDAPGQRDIFQAVLNFTAPGSAYVGDLEVLPLLKTIGSALGIETGPRDSTAPDSNDLMVALSMQQADSRGDLRTISADPTVPPEIDYNYLSAESDGRRSRDLVRVGAQLLQTAAFVPYYKELVGLDDATLHDDRLLDEWCRAHLMTAVHMCGTAKMGASDDPDSVVDQYGRVHGVAGLRVADTSILPFAPSRGPAATAIMIGERVADFLN